MALNKGNPDCTSGLSKRLYDKKKLNIEARDGWADLPQDNKDKILDALKEDAWAEAQAHIDEIDENAEIENGKGSYIVGTLIAGPNPVLTVPPAIEHTTVAGGIK